MICPVKCAYDELVSIRDLRPHPRNPNKHSEKQVALLAKIIAAQGWRLPITVSTRSGYIIRGHARLLAAQQLGIEHCPVDYQDYDSDEAEWADLVADNRIAELADTDYPMLAALLADLNDRDLDMDLTGFSAEEIDRLLLWQADNVVEDPTTEWVGMPSFENK